ncbi:MAG: bacteriophage holin [Bacteroidota bacterium]
MRLRIRAFGMAVGIVSGLVVFIATIFSIWFGQGFTIGALSVAYPGYNVTYLGAFIGFVWGFVDGLIAGALVAWLYNRFHKAFYSSDTAG